MGVTGWGREDGTSDEKDGGLGGRILQAELDEAVVLIPKGRRLGERGRLFFRKGEAEGQISGGDDGGR